MVTASFLNPIFSWTMNLPLWVTIMGLSFFITLFVNLVQKKVSDQAAIKRIKKQMKKFQKEIKQYKDDPKKQLAIQQKMMKLNGELMSKSLKPMLYTLLPLFFVFGWMSANLSLEPLQSGDEVVVVMQMREPAIVTLNSSSAKILSDPTVETVEKIARWKVSADSGEHELVFTANTGESTSHTLVVGKKPDSKIKAHQAPFKKSEIRYEKAKPFGSFSLFGYQPGWLMTYILFSLAFSLIFRRLLKLH